MKLMGLKLDMTRIFNDEGRLIPATKVKILDNKILSKKQNEDKYVMGCIKMNKMYNGKKFKIMYESQIKDDNYKVGNNIGIKYFLDNKIDKVNVESISKGKGFQGVMKKYNFRGGPASHGSHHHREPGSIGQCDKPGKVRKGLKMAGHMGMEKHTKKNIPILQIDDKNNIIYLKGSFSGFHKSLVVISVNNG